MSEIIYCKLTEKDKPSLLEAISNIIKDTEAHYLDGAKESVWNWQYQNLPSNESHIYVAKFQNEIIGYYHIPTYQIKVANELLKVGQIQAVAVLASYRGKGVFQKLAEFANDDINKHLDIIYTFPNNKSIHTFTKYNNFDFVRALPVYILPLNIANIIPLKYKLLKSMRIIWSAMDALFGLFSKSLSKNESVKTFQSITPEIENLFLKFGNKNNIRLVRNSEFLNWRYINSPKGVHKIYGLTDKGNLKSVVIVKEEEIFSCKGLVVMDFAYETTKDFQKLLSNLFQDAKNKTNDSESFIFIAGLNKGLKSLKYCGFIPIPQKFVPRKLNLLTRWTNKKISKDLTDHSSWLITVGDWDVF